jgi:putative tryptophan/tyrosine transport system substrate-binding protein
MAHRSQSERKPVRKKFLVFILTTSFLASVNPTHAQQPTKILRIGYLDSSTASGSAVLVDAFRQEMRKLGWIEEKNITIEYRFAEQKNERLPELAADLVRLKIDLLVVTGTPSALAAKNATTTIPVVMVNVSDPMGVGLVASLARPALRFALFSWRFAFLLTRAAGRLCMRCDRRMKCWSKE